MSDYYNKKIVVVAGGSGYLGSHIVSTLIKADFFVVIIATRNNNNFVNNSSVYFLDVDISDSEAVAKGAQEIFDKFGKIFAIIQAASAPLIRESILVGSVDAFRSQFKVNVVGAFNLFKYFCPNMIENGMIVGITSQAIESEALITSSGSYIPAKYALRGLLRVLATELQKQSISVCAVAPAFMPGGLNGDISEPVMEFIKKKSQPENITSPEYVAQVVVDLLNKKIENINSKSIAVPSRVITNL